MKAIETIYKGYRFRSRLEARWAVFFDALGIDWQYEVEGFELDNGEWYLPDFKIKAMVLAPCRDGQECYNKDINFNLFKTDALYIEVKPSYDSMLYEVVEGKAGSFNDRIIITCGDPLNEPVAFLSKFDKDSTNRACVPSFFGKMPSFFEIDNTRAYVLLSQVPDKWVNEKQYVDFNIFLDEAGPAKLMGRQARFEHGEGER